MKQLLRGMSLAYMVASATACTPSVGAFAPQRHGALVVVGGGGTPPAVIEQTLVLAGGHDAIVVVLAQASSSEDAGESTVRLWREAGARQVTNVSLHDVDLALQHIREATLIWMPGGDQNRLMGAFRGTGVPEAIRARQRQGAVVGGTSAGAAVLSTAMITGDADLESIRATTTIIDTGLGLWPNVIIDQHFLVRRRMNRLIAAILDRPHLVGVGIDERTAVVLRGSRFEVVGEGAVMVVDGRRARVTPPERNAIHSARGIALHLLISGMDFDLRADT